MTTRFLVLAGLALRCTTGYIAQLRAAPSRRSTRGASRETGFPQSFVWDEDALDAEASAAASAPSGKPGKRGAGGGGGGAGSGAAGGGGGAVAAAGPSSSVGGLGGGGEKRVPSMQELMRITEEKLLARQADAAEREATEGTLTAQHLDGSRGVYLEQLEELAGRVSIAPSATRPQFCVAVVLGKALCRGRISVEHAARCCALVRALAEKRLEPDMILFAASAASKSAGSRDDATAACTYFLHLCDSIGLRVEERTLAVSPMPITTRVGMKEVLEASIAPHLDAASRLHLAFFASDYQLSRLERIGAVTPHLSLFAPLAERRDKFLQHVAESEARAKTAATREKKGETPETAASPPEPHKTGAANGTTTTSSSDPTSALADLDPRVGGATSWSLEKVCYPPGLLVSRDDAFAASFLAQTHVIFDSLVPLLVNCHAIVNREEFLAREYYDDLLLAKRRVSEQLRLVDSPMRPAALRLKTMASLSPHVIAKNHPNAKDPEDANRTFLIDEALERVLHWLSEIERLIRPAATRQDFLDTEDWQRALELLQRAMAEARAATDPDMPLPASHWGRLIDKDEPNYGDLDLHDLLLLQRLPKEGREGFEDPEDSGGMGALL